ncbi:MAG: transcription antitermination factor NusB [Akkermansiaceae bacterium]|nr:transcription antitermination factor NusB [Akkermansiaceae bacterium]
MTADRDQATQSQPKKPGPRREGREIALQYLFGHELNAEADPESPEAEDFWRLRPARPRSRAFAVALLRGVIANLAEIDARIAASVENYALNRLAGVDRNLLRLAVYELAFDTDVPPAVAINEAIEIAKRFGTEESARFVNGVLDRIRKEQPR